MQSQREVIGAVIPAGRLRRAINTQWVIKCQAGGLSLPFLFLYSWKLITVWISRCFVNALIVKQIWLR